MSNAQAQIIFVDDDPIALFLHDMIIRDCVPGASPHCFDQAEQALALLAAGDSCEKAFLIFLDINMPGMDGWTFLDALNKSNLRASTQVVMLTSSIEAADRQRAGSFDIVLDFLEKPFSQDQIAALGTRHSLDNFLQHGNELKVPD
ncbi:two-component system response regulator [Pedobacter aquatilis]|uniref:response regulator n=1 Tax=Pedobacter aquatilis TaxID=351343 RepID=UPI00292E62CA|nr:response regulator [Pedobacter aquatilis]